MKLGLLRATPKTVRKGDDWLYNGFSSFFDDFFSETEGWTKSRWSPTVEVEEKKDALIVKAELPGLKDSDLDVRIENNVLYLKGEKQREKKEKDDQGRIFFSEVEYGSFERSFALPDYVNQDKIKATFKNGVLYVSLPKDEKKLPSKIKVEVNN